MIEFKGEHTQAVKNFVTRIRTARIKANALFGVLLLGFVVMELVFPRLFTWYKQPPMPLIIGSAFAAILWFAFFVLPLKKQSHGNDLPDRVSVEDGAVCSYYGKQCERVAVSAVLKVVDFGEFYYVCRDKADFAFFVCQKNLISGGTIEEFEALFEGKIVRKYK